MFSMGSIVGKMNALLFCWFLLPGNNLAMYIQSPKEFKSSYLIILFLGLCQINTKFAAKDFCSKTVAIMSLTKKFGNHIADE